MVDRDVDRVSIEVSIASIDWHSIAVVNSTHDPHVSISNQLAQSLGGRGGSSERKKERKLKRKERKLYWPSLCKIQLQSNSALAWRKYLPSVHRAAFVPVIMAVPENIQYLSRFDDEHKSHFSYSKIFSSFGNRFPGALTVRSAESRNEFPPLMLWRNIFALKHLTCVSLKVGSLESRKEV